MCVMSSTVIEREDLRKDCALINTYCKFNLIGSRGRTGMDLVCVIKLLSDHAVWGS